MTGYLRITRPIEEPLRDQDISNRPVESPGKHAEENHFQTSIRAHTLDLADQIVVLHESIFITPEEYSYHLSSLNPAPPEPRYKICI